MKRIWPLLMIALIALVVYWGWCVLKGQALHKPITGLIGYSPYNTSPMPSSPAGASHTMGQNIQAR